MSQERSAPTPTNPAKRVDHELSRWRRIYSGEEYFYGSDPGPLVRRTVRYHRPSGISPEEVPPTALDVGCGEGQDLRFLAEQGYAAIGLEFVPEAAAKAERLLQESSLRADVIRTDIRQFEAAGPFDLVLAANVLQFLGPDAPSMLDRLMDLTAPGGVLGVSLFGRELSEAPLAGTIYFFTFQEILDRFSGWQRLESARLWQWNVATDEPQPFITMIARKAAPNGQRIVLQGARG